MREIKFRAWDLAEEEMLSENDLDNRIVETGEDGYFHFLKVARYIPLQYTGLKDKNGVEIYDGDVLEWDKAEWGDEHFETVLWDYNLFSLRERDWPQFCEVIGNTYEHPRQLKAKK